MTTPSQHADVAAADHPPARSGTPTAWATLLLVILLVAGWMFAGQVLCEVIRTGAIAWAWSRGETLRIGRLDIDESGSLRASDLEWTKENGAARDHRSTIRCEMAIITPASIQDWVLPRPGRDRLWIRELWMSKTRILLDLRRDTARSASVTGSSSTRSLLTLPPVLLPGSIYAGPLEAVIIGEKGRVAFHDLRLDLPSRWTGRVAFRGAEADVGSGHRVIPGASTRAFWEPGSLRIGTIPLGEGLTLGELTLHLVPGRLEFGLKGTIGKGLLRGDGSLGGEIPLEVTLVGERLGIEAVTGLIGGSTRASGTVDQARLSFRGDLGKPMDADGSIRLIGRNFRWEGKGWESLRLAAAMTGRNLTLSELSLRQGDNEMVAEGHTSLPADWHALLRAPFTANFRAYLTDAGTLASLFGSDATFLGGSLYLDGAIRGADNKAEGYCNLSGLGTKIRRLTLDWVKGCLLFDGSTTRIPYVEAAAGADGISLSGSVENSRPHAYKGEAEGSVKDLARLLNELGLAVSPSIGAGAVSGSWAGQGNMTTHRGEFHASFNEWVSRWTRGGLSGTVEGTYAPESLNLSKAQLVQKDLTLTMAMTATTNRVSLSGISVVKAGSGKPLATGEISLPFSGADFWTSGDFLKTLAMDQPLTVNLKTEGLRAEQLNDLLGQTASCTGKLEGWITAAGSVATPELNGSLLARGFTPDEHSTGSDLELKMETKSGETTASVNRDNPAAPLHLECNLPVKLAKNGSTLASDPASKIRGELKVQKLPLDGWISFLTGSTNRDMKNLTADGAVTMSGTIGEPRISGNLLMTIGEYSFWDSKHLTDISLPLSFSAATVNVLQGTGRYEGNPMVLTGSGDWSTRSLSMKLGGTNLPIPLSPGLAAKAQADLKYTLSASAPTTLSGTLRLDPISTDPGWYFAPVFTPPGLRMEAVPDVVTAEAAPRIDLSISTATTNPTQGPALMLQLHLAGTTGDLKTEGSVTAMNQTLRLPTGALDLPKAIVEFGKEGARLSGTAQGFTASGWSALRLGGSLEQPTAELDAPGAAADWIFSCTRMPQATAAHLLQAPYWLRQASLLQVPAKPWSTAWSGDADLSSLGFYGTPWIWNLIPERNGKSGEQPTR